MKLHSSLSTRARELLRNHPENTTKGKKIPLPLAPTLEIFFGLVIDQ